MQRTSIRGRRLAACAAAAVLAASSFAGGAFPLAASAADGPEYKYSVLAGGDRIGMNIYINGSGTFNDVLVNGSGWDDCDVTASGIVIQLTVGAAEMRKPFDISFSLGGQTYTKEGISVCQYLQDLKKDSTAAQYHDVAQAMLDYGYAAEEYFSDEAVRSAAYGLSAAPDFSGVTVAGSAYSGKTAFNTALAAEPVQYYGMNLTLLDQIRFSLFFRNTGAQSEAIGFLGGSTFGGGAVVPEDLSPDYSRIYLTVPASRLTEDCAFANGSISETFSPVQYLAAAAAGEDAGLAALCKALYAYGEAVNNVSSVEPHDPEKWESLEATGATATFYDYGGAYPVGNALLDDFIADNHMNIAALTDDDYHKYVGGCIRVQRGDKSVCALVGDIMPLGSENPNAVAGDVDLNENAFKEIADTVEGRVSVTWQLIPLPTAETAPVSYAVKEGSNLYWAGIQVRNTTYPVAKLEWSADGTNFTEIQRKSDCYNYFVLESGGAKTVTFRITDIFGQVVTDKNVTLPLTGTDSAAVQLVSGSGVQFPK
ncbi:MAG: hypothetical protein J5722_00205 [Oscillospiraceae bacterium]|nr:hypothetical protein [Oscillospiraceae bacterium]